MGKSTLINSLFLTDLYPERCIPGAAGMLSNSLAHAYRLCNKEEMSAAKSPAELYLRRTVWNAAAFKMTALLMTQPD